MSLGEMHLHADEMRLNDLHADEMRLNDLHADEMRLNDLHADGMHHDVSRMHLRPFAQAKATIQTYATFKGGDVTYKGGDVNEIKTMIETRWPEPGTATAAQVSEFVIGLHPSRGRESIDDETLFHLSGKLSEPVVLGEDNRILNVEALMRTLGESPPPISECFDRVFVNRYHVGQNYEYLGYTESRGLPEATASRMLEAALGHTTLSGEIDHEAVESLATNFFQLGEKWEQTKADVALKRSFARVGSQLLLTAPGGEPRLLTDVIGASQQERQAALSEQVAALSEQVAALSEQVAALTRSQNAD